jgi:hypothetical protein
MLCKRCGKKTERGWRFCPNCGSSLQPSRRSLFDEIFSRFRSEFDDMDSMDRFDKEFGVLDLSPFFRGMGKGTPNRKGFTIRITRKGNDAPKVDVQTFGQANNDEIRREISRRMRRLDPSAQGMVRKTTMDSSHDQLPRPEPRKDGPKDIHIKPAKITEEPEAAVKVIGDRVIVDMDLPDVRSGHDIQINQLESSVEVRARAGDKAYFKIITKPERLSLTSRKFDKGMLHLEFS